MRVIDGSPGAEFRFEAPGVLPSEWEWRHEPPWWSTGRERDGGGLEMRTAPETDFWQRTHYGFQRHNGHALLAQIKGNFQIATRAHFESNSQYDQSGLLVFLDEENWIKCSTEYETPELNRLGSVVTNGGYSDWASQDVAGVVRATSYRITRVVDDFLLEYSTEAGEQWKQMRITHMPAAEGRSVIRAGVYACSPIGTGFCCRFGYIEVGPASW
jgi:uncharacterized protein